MRPENQTQHTAKGGEMARQAEGDRLGSQTTFVYVASGDFGPKESGKVSVYELDRQGGTLQLVDESLAGGLASFLAIDRERGRLFVADEEAGGVLSFAVDKSTGKLEGLGATVHTSHPVYLTLTPDGQRLLAANYNEASVDVYPIDETGRAGAPIQTIVTGSHAHAVVLDAEGRVLVANEGADTISHFTFDGGRLQPALPPTTSSFAPRHFALDGGERVYVVSERGDFISAFERSSNASLRELWRVPRLDFGTPLENTGADIHLSPNGRYLYASNRGASNTIAVFELTRAAPKLLEHEPTRGTTPRNFAMDPDGEFLIVGNHGSEKSITIFAIQSDGRLELVRSVPTEFSPYFLTFAQY